MAQQDSKSRPLSVEQKKVVYLGHLVERQGVSSMVKALHIVMKNDPSVTADIIGSGPLEKDLKDLTKQLGIEEHIKFHGFVKDHKDVESILAQATIAIAPYVKDETSFTQFADPGKLKAYLGASLPMVITDVPPNAKELQKAGAALVVKDNPKNIAAGLETLLSSESKWQAAHKAAAELAKEFDWDRILKTSLKKLGFK